MELDLVLVEKKIDDKIDNKIDNGRLLNEELLNDVKLLNAIMNDLGDCVKEQGEKLVQIENNLIITENIIDKSITELTEANKYKEKINKKYLTLAGIGGILLYLILL